MRKMMNEQLPISKSSPLKARFYDYPYFTYPWHFHTEYEIIYVKEGTGMRFVGNNAEKYADGDILLLGSDLPHYMKSDEVYRQEGSTLRTTGTIIQFEKDFMHHAFNYYPHFMKIKNLLEEGPAGKMPCREGMPGEGKRQKDLCCGLLPGPGPADGAGLYHRDQPHPAPVQAHERSGILRPALAPQRHGQADALRPAALILRFASHTLQKNWANP